MKKLLLLLFPLLFLACEPDFDELRDTDQRYVTFDVDLTNMFSDLLVESEGGFSLGDVSSLDPRYRIRITAYCYDYKDLVKSYTFFSTPSECPEITFRHLAKDKEYQFLFLADVVRFNSEADYYETWYQMKTTDLSQFYLISFDRSDTAIYNKVNRSMVSLVPENQREKVVPTSATYNGFINFMNLESIDKIDVYFMSYSKWYAQTLVGMQKLTKVYELYNLHHEGDRLFPTTLCMADRQASMIIKTYSSAGIDSTTVKILDGSRRPFVVDFDCQSMKVTSSIYY